MKKKSQFLWWLLAFGLGAAIAVFIFVPLGLVSHYVGLLAPDGSEWIGLFYSLGLSLSIIALSGLAYQSSGMRWKIGAAIIAVAEGLISLAMFAAKINGDLLNWLGLFGIVAIQETTIFLCSQGLFDVINRIRNPFANERTANEQRTHAAQANAHSEQGERSQRGDVRRRIIEANKANPALGVSELAARLGVSKSFVSETLKSQRGIGFRTQ